MSNDSLGQPELSDDDVKSQESETQVDGEIPIEGANDDEIDNTMGQIPSDEVPNMENEEYEGEESEAVNPLTAEGYEEEEGEIDLGTAKKVLGENESEEVEPQSDDERGRKAAEEMIEAKKEGIRKELKALKMEFRALVQKNDEISEEFRVPKDQFELDPRIKAPKREQVLKEVGEIYRKYEWDGQRSVLACEKIQKFFLENVETPHVIVMDLEHTTQVHTIRLAHLSQLFWEMFEKNKTLLIDEETLLNAPPEEEEEESKPEAEPVKRYYAKDLIGDYEGKSYNIKTMHAIRQLEDRLHKKYKREIELAEIMEQKVPDSYEAPEDVEAIKIAEATIGDYKMKSAEEYKGEQISIAERRQRILDLKLWIYGRIVEFNKLIRRLQHEKIHVLEKCKKLETKIRDVQKQIQMDMRKPLPVIHDIEEIEMSEKTFEISPEVIIDRQNKKLEAAGITKRKEELDQMYHTPVDMQNAIPDPIPKSKVKRKRPPIRKEGDFVRGRNDPRAPKVDVAKPQTQASLQSQQKGPQQFGGGKALGKALNLEGLSLAVWKYRKSNFNPKTEAGIRKRDRMLAVRCFERDKLLEKLQRLIDYFKHRVICVRNERIELEMDIKLMTIGLYIRIRELSIVQECDAMEKDINDRQKAQKLECSFVQERMERVSKRLKRAEGDQSKIEEALAKILKEATQIIGEKGRFVKYLWKLYRKQIKEEDEEEEEENDENETEEIEGEASEGDEDEERSTDSISSGSSHSSLELEVDETESEEMLEKPPRNRHNIFICPEDLDPNVYEKISELRQSRAFLETGLAEQIDIVEKIRNDLQQLENNKARLEYRIEEMSLDLITLEKDKILRMNGLKNLVILKADQIQCLDDETADESMKGGLLDRLRKNFPNIDNVIIFPKDGTQRLDMRIEEMKGEIQTEKAKQRRARHMIVRLREELHTKELRVQILEEGCKNDMIGKFGQVVDLDTLSASSINLKILDDQQVLENKRKRYYKERDVLQKEIEDTKYGLTGVTKMNSECNTLLAILEERQRDVDYFLFKQNKAKADAMASVSQKSTKIQSAPGTQQQVNIKYEPSADKGFDDNDDVVLEMYDLEDRVINQESKIAYLRDAISIAKVKHGIPPILPLTCIPDQVGFKFMTYSELQDYKKLISGEVETLYKKDNITERLLKSESKVPSLDDTRIEEDEDTAENVQIPSEEALEDNKYFRFKRNDEMGGEDYAEGPYPINIIPDDQMKKGQPDSTDIEEEEEEEEGYDTDPIPVTRGGQKPKEDLAEPVKPSPQPQIDTPKEKEEEEETIEDETENIPEEEEEVEEAIPEEEFEEEEEQPVSIIENEEEDNEE